MIEPFSETQVSAQVISDGLLSYGYDLSVSDEFKIFTNVNSAIIDPKAFDERSFVSVRGESVIVQPNWFALARSVEYFRIPRDVLTICVEKSTYARCGITSERDAIRAGVGGVCNPRDIEYHASTGQGLRQRRAVPDPVFPFGLGLRCQLRRPEGQVPETTRDRVAQAVEA
jgi:deoxycytidine triphosphate deaminase